MGRTTTMDQFLWQVLEYFHLYLQYQRGVDLTPDEADGYIAFLPLSFTCYNSVVSDADRKELKSTTEQFEKAKSNLSAVYITVIAGLGMKFSHHSLQGRLV